MAVTGGTDSMFAGNKRTKSFTVTDEDNSPAPKDLTGLVVRWALSPLDSEGNFSTDPILEKTSTDSAQIEITDESNGELDVKLVGIDTDDLVGDYYEELEVFDGTEEAVVVYTGTLTIIGNVNNTVA